MERLGADAERLLAAAGVPRADALGAIAAAWPASVGDAVARNAWPHRLGRDGTLQVATTSSAWAFELAQLAPEVLARLQVTLGDAAPSSLRFAPGPVPEPPAPSDRATEQPPAASSAELERAAALTTGIADEELRGLVARAAAASLARSADNHRVW